MTLLNQVAKSVTISCCILLFKSVFHMKTCCAPFFVCRTDLLLALIEALVFMQPSFYKLYFHFEVTVLMHISIYLCAQAFERVKSLCDFTNGKIQILFVCHAHFEVHL